MNSKGPLQLKKQQDKFALIELVDRFYWYLFALCMAGLVFLTFYRLGDEAVVTWDEARHGINAYEMLQRGNYWINYFNGNPDLWNLKPPLSFWFIILGYQIFGFNTWGLRFFSAVAFVLTVLIIALFLKKEFNNLSSLFVIIIFASCQMFYNFHYARAGDPDAIYILFFTICIITLYLSVKNTRWLYLAALSFALAFLTKSYHVFVLLPVIFLYILLTGGFKRIKWYQYIITILIAVLPIITWAVMRVLYDGNFFFLKEMLFFDVFTRSTTTFSNSSNWDIYFQVIIKNSPFFICSLFIILRILKKIIKKENLVNYDKLMMLAIGTQSLIYTMVKTRYEHYFYPVGCLIIAYGAVAICELFYDLDIKVLLRYSILFVNIFVFSILISNTYYADKDGYFKSPNCNAELQSVIINGLPTHNIQNSQYYFIDGSCVDFSYNDDSKPYLQDVLCVFEWRTGQLLDSGGYEVFKLASNAYIIMNKKNLVELSEDELDKFVIIYQSENYVIGYH